MRRLKRTSVAITHIAGKSQPKALFDIVAGILALDVDWKEGFGESFKAVHAELPDKDHAIDCGFAATGASFDVFAGAGSYVTGPPDNALAYFAFRLLWKLQSLGTVPGVDWMAYADQLGHQLPK